MSTAVGVKNVENLKEKMSLVEQQLTLTREAVSPKGFLIMWIQHKECGSVLRMRVGSSIIGLLTGRADAYTFSARCPVCKRTFEVKFAMEDYNDPLYNEPPLPPPPPIDNPTLLYKTVALDLRRQGV